MSMIHRILAMILCPDNFIKMARPGMSAVIQTEVTDLPALQAPPITNVAASALAAIGKDKPNRAVCCCKIVSCGVFVNLPDRLRRNLSAFRQ